MINVDLTQIANFNCIRKLKAGIKTVIIQYLETYLPEVIPSFQAISAELPKKGEQIDAKGGN